MTFHTDISQINIVEWQQLINESPTATFFQTNECYDFYASLSFMKPFVVAVSENGKLTGLILGYIIAEGNQLKQFFSRRAIVPGGALLSETISDLALQQLLEQTQKLLSKKAIYIELRNYNDFSNWRTIFETSTFNYQPHLNFHVATPDVETALKKLSTTKRRDVKLSRKEGAEWIDTKDFNDVEAYFDILKNLYATRIKTPLYPVEFFKKLVALPQGKLFVVKHSGKVIGGSVCVLLPNNTIYEWFVCGLDGQTKNVFPSTIATWAAIEYAASKGFQRFDMMGAGKPYEGYGVREFKSKFGGELVEHGRFLYICKPGLYKLGKFIVKILRSK